MRTKRLISARCILAVGFFIICQPIWASKLACIQALSGNATAQISAFQQEMIENWQAYQARYPERFWNAYQLIGPERMIVDPSFGKDGHVIELAGGANTLRIRYLFPLAKHIHTADIIDPTFNHNVISEYMDRLHALAPDAKVEIIQEGFYQRFKELFGTGIKPLKVERYDQYAAELRSNAYARRPLIAKVRWASPSMGGVERIFYFHPIDLGRSDEISELVSSIPTKENLVGMIMFGVGPFSSLERGRHSIKMGFDTASGYWRLTDAHGQAVDPGVLRSQKVVEMIEILKSRLSAPVNEQMFESVYLGLKYFGYFFKRISIDQFEIGFKSGLITSTKFLITRYRQSVETVAHIDKVLSMGEVVGLTMGKDAAMEAYYTPLFERLAVGGSYITADQNVSIAHIIPQNFRHQKARAGEPHPIFDPDLFQEQIDIFQKQK